MSAASSAWAFLMGLPWWTWLFVGIGVLNIALFLLVRFAAHPRRDGASALRPGVSMRFTPRQEALFWGFQYYNAGPGTAFHVGIEPLISNGYRATFDRVPELRKGETYEPIIPSVELIEGDGDANIRRDCLEALVSETPSVMVLTFEDGEHRIHREEYEIYSGYIGPIRVSRKRSTS